jgi:hypothetical protein
MQDIKGYVLLVDAEVTDFKTKSGLGRIVIFGDLAITVAISKSKIIDGCLYVEQRIANLNKDQWKGEYVPGTRGQRMRAVETPTTTAIKEAIDTMQEQIDKLQRVLNRHEKSRDEIDTEAKAAVIMRAINKKRDASDSTR